MNLLAIDTACSFLSVAVGRGDEVYYSETEAGTKHSESVMLFIDDLMKKAGLRPQDLNGVFCMGGPGSFTGLRIGYSIAKGLALSLSVPFAPVPTLDCMACPGAGGSSLVLPLIPARKNAFYYTVFRAGQRLCPDADAETEQILSVIKSYKEKIILTGAGARVFYDSLSPEDRELLELSFEAKGCARELLALAMERDLINSDCEKYLFCGPEYIRKTDAEINLKN
jgi:tRNA threonylcarbamoyladenosine biosynthesis protein TsaB